MIIVLQNLQIYTIGNEWSGFKVYIKSVSINKASFNVLVLFKEFNLLLLF